MLPPSLPSAWGPTKIYLYAQPTDMRKSFDGLHAIVQSEFRRDIRLGDVFLFLNRRRDRIKLLHWDRDGLAIWMKRLERGTFQRPRRSLSGEPVEMDTWRGLNSLRLEWRGGLGFAELLPRRLGSPCLL